MKDQDTKENREIHVYDGIEEHDNQLPRWWLMILFLTVVFSLFYCAHYWAGPGRSIQETHEEELRQRDLQEIVRSSKVPSLNEEQLAALASDPQRKSQGNAVFQAQCSSCHGNHAQGGIGPNLTDDFWIHGGKLVDLVKTVTQGVPEKGMPPWRANLSAEEIQSVSLFIRSLRGSDPAGAKAPQGEKVSF